MRTPSVCKARLKSAKPPTARSRKIWAWRVLLLGLVLPLFRSPVSRAQDSTPPAAGPSPNLVASEAGPSPSPTPTPPRTAAENASFAAAFRRGWDAANEHRYHDAITEYNEAIRLKPDDPSVYDNRGTVYQILKQYPQAVADYSEAIRLKPDLAEAYNDRGNSYSALQQFDQAIADYTEAVRLRADFTAAFFIRALTYFVERRYDDAIKDCDALLLVNPNFPNAYFTRGNASYALKQYKEAIADYNRAISLKTGARV